MCRRHVEAYYAPVVELDDLWLELIHAYCIVRIHMLWKSCDVRPVPMASWNRGFCSPLFYSVMRVPLY